ncbi:MAG: redox-sensing transcriptional repressor Rex [Defluviitaleaceae bacterium]|nr:redox-sensing transcriptional repressor Rex [Defluviitaleaceae bacterium]
MKDGRKISTAVIRRLPRYYRYLGDLLDKDITRISSKDLSQRMGITASQIRQDLNHFGCFGQQGYGYNVELLYQEVKHILGLDRSYNVILVGAGNFGQVLINNQNFAKRGFDFVAAFDNNPDVVGTNVGNIKVMDVAKLTDYISKNRVDIAALTLPSGVVQDVSKIVADAGVKGIWNFSHDDLRLPHDVIVENVRLTDSIMTLSYKISEDEILRRAVRDVW